MTASNSPPRNDTWKAKYVPPVAVDSADTLVALIPHHWSCASLEELAEVIDPNPSHRYPTYTRGSIPLLSTREFRGRDAWDASGSNVPFVPPNVHQEQNERCRFSPRDLIMARKGRLGLARHAPPLKSFVFSHTVFVIKAVDEVEPDFLLWYLRLDRVVAWLRREMNDNTGVPTLGKATTERLPVPLPPLQEQKLIVARVEHLMKVCDALEAKLLRSEDRAAKLVEAVVREVAQ
jgi:type I restriction enzyme S subunit